MYLKMYSISMDFERSCKAQNVCLYFFAHVIQLLYINNNLELVLLITDAKVLLILILYD